MIFFHPASEKRIPARRTRIWFIPTETEGSHGIPVYPAIEKIPAPFDLSSASLGHPTLSGGTHLFRLRSKQFGRVIPTEVEGSHGTPC